MTLKALRADQSRNRFDIKTFTEILANLHTAVSILNNQTNENQTNVNNFSQQSQTIYNYAELIGPFINALCLFYCLKLRIAKHETFRIEKFKATSIICVAYL